MQLVTLKIDGAEVEAEKGATILDAARKAGIYIPALCAHADLPPPLEAKASSFVYRGNLKIEGDVAKEFEGCKICVVQVEGRQGFPLACDTPVADGMVIQTNTPEIQKLRRDNLAPILAKHPHACLTCGEREGCAREPCSLNVPKNERCCPKLGRCELQEVAEYVGIREDIPRYVFRDLPILKNEPLFDRDYNICIGCTRCVRICRDVRGVEALDFAYRKGEVIVGSVGPTLKESGCKFCGACVEVCPTGALTDRDVKVADREAGLVPCSHTCPAGIDVPQYVRLIAEGKFAEAAAVIREKVPFPNVLGHVCHHPCEDECRRGQVNEPIAICALKRFAAEHDTGLWKSSLKVAPATGKKVAIVGSGPAGLAASYYLSKLGHKVTVFESLPEPGGMMWAGIPGYRLPRDALRKDIEEIMKLGVELRTGTPISQDPSALRDQGYQAIFLAPGAQLSKKLKIEGIDLEGVLWGVDFLRDINLGRKIQLKDRVFVIGGGNVAIDVALTALRLGAKQVQLACLECREEMPAHPWEIQQAVEEGVALNVSWGPKRIIGDAGKVAGIELVRCTSVFDKEGKFNPCFDNSATTSMETDMVIVAIGQAPDLSFLGKESKVGVTPAGLVQANVDTLETNVPGVFTGGEVVTGPASVIEAVAMGRKAAVSIDRYLGGKGEIDEALIQTGEPSPRLGREEGFADKPRTQMPRLPLEKRRGSFVEVELGFDQERAVNEAKRCLRCDLRLEISPIMLPPKKWLEFSPQNVAAVPETEGVYQLLDEKETVIYIKGTANLRKDLEEQIKTNKKARYFGHEEVKMYTIRESELLSQFAQKYGKMPEGNVELEEDLF